MCAYMNNILIISKIAYFILRKAKTKFMVSQEEVELFLKARRDNDFKTDFHTDFFEDMKFVSFNKNTDSVILYIHGNALDK